MPDKPYLSVATATFLSEGDFEGFMTKATTFNSEKALAYLKENGQRNFSIIRDDDEKSVRAMLVWEYESREAWQNCQEFWTSWFKYEDNYVAKATFVRGECIFDWSDSWRKKGQWSPGFREELWPFGTSGVEKDDRSVFRW